MTLQPPYITDILVCTRTTCCKIQVAVQDSFLLLVSCMLLALSALCSDRVAWHTIRLIDDLLVACFIPPERTATTP